jgi:DNA polymerase III epsilon subunit-like protein
MTFATFDTATTGKINWKQPLSWHGQPRIVSTGAVLFDDVGRELASYYSLIRPEGFLIPSDATKVHGITTEKAEQYGVNYNIAMTSVISMLNLADYILIFNEAFDRNMVNIEALMRSNANGYLERNRSRIRCMMQVMTARCKLAHPYDTGDYKGPSLDEAWQYTFGLPRDVSKVHNAGVDARETGLIALELIRRNDWNINDAT